MAQLPESDYDLVVSSKETLSPPKNMTCDPPNEDASLCSHRGIGPAWTFRGGYLYLRVVNFACYSVRFFPPLFLFKTKTASQKITKE